MKILFQTVLFATFLTSSAFHSLAQAGQGTYFDLSDQFFKTYVDESGNVDYEAIVKDSKSLDQLTSIISNYDLTNASTAESKAFYTNAYNILVIKQIVESYPIKGPLRVNGFFDKLKNKVAGEELTLNQTEKEKNLYVNGDERLHFALVCGAKGCPPLANYAYTPESIESQLEDRTIIALNNDYFVRENKGKIELSQIFSWYNADFKNEGRNDVIGYLNKYRTNQIPKETKIVYYTYNWNLNKK
ncbi:MAG: hypothetical protein ACI9GZ_003779 [Bacteroidia bacterium]|jgi:hypothetical protein